jgi:cysteine-rich repeat protein
MYKYVLPLLLALGCGAKSEIQITVDADPQALGNAEIVSLQLVLIQNGDSGAALFENDGDPIDFPVTLSTRVDADRLNTLHIGVAGVDADGLTILGGNILVTLDGGNKDVAVLMNQTDPCVAGDGTDIGCCTNFFDDDGNGLGDCAEPACAAQFPDLCEGAVCGDGILNPFAAESCDDGNTQGNDGCSATCLAEQDQLFAFVEYSEVIDVDNNDNDLSVMANNSFRANEGFVVVQESGDCKKLDILAAVRQDDNFFFANYGQLDAVRPNVSVRSILVDELSDPTIIGIDAQFNAPAPMQFAFSGGPDMGGKLLFAGNSPTQLVISPEEAVRNVTRNQDATISWTPTPGLDENVVVSFFERNGATQIFCQAPDAQGSLVIPAEFTRALPKGNFQQNGGYFLFVGHGQLLEVPVVPGDSPQGLLGTLFVTVDKGTQIVGDIF